MGKNKIWVLALLLIFALFFAGNVKAYHVTAPSCNYLLVGASNISDNGATQNQTFVTVLSTTSNQTQTGSGSTFVRLENQNGYALFTNYTGIIANGSGETATYSVRYSPSLDAQQTYKISATVYFLNNSFYNYTGTSFACANRTFVVDAVSGGYVVQQQVIAAETAKKSGSTMLLVVAAIVVIIIVISSMKNKR